MFCCQKVSRWRPAIHQTKEEYFTHQISSHSLECAITQGVERRISFVQRISSYPVDSNEKKLMTRAYAQRPTKFFELGLILLIAQNKKFDLLKIISKDCFTHRSEIENRLWMNVVCIRSPTARGSLNCLADWPRGTTDWPLALFLLVGLTMPKCAARCICTIRSSFSWIESNTG